MQATGEKSDKGNNFWSGYICFDKKPLVKVFGTESSTVKEKNNGSGTWTDHKILVNAGEDLLGAFSFIPRGTKDDGTLKKQMIVGDITFGPFFFPTSAFLNDEKQSASFEYSQYGFDRNGTDTSDYKKEYVVEDPEFDLTDSMDEIAEAYPEFTEWDKAAFPGRSGATSKKQDGETINKILALAKNGKAKKQIDWD